MIENQHVVSRSSAEVEFRSIAATLAELSWLNSLLSELHISCPASPTVFCDNLSVVLLAVNPILSFFFFFGINKIQL